MGNHFHLVVRMHPEDEVSDEEIIKRYKEYYGEDKYLAKEQVYEVRKRLCSLAAYVKDIKQGFTGQADAGIIGSPVKSCCTCHFVNFTG
jgi:sirohydrochlorin ferrochelatase